MKNEIERKITSLTLMTIMVAGGMTFAMPEVIPQAFADVVQSNPHLYVSVEGQNSNNEFSPGNIIEIVVIDPLISDTDEGKGEPIVTVDGKDIRMVQATDGAWYAYIADADGAKQLDQAVLGAGVAPGLGTDLGSFCDPTGATTLAGIGLTDTVGVAFPGVGGIQGDAALNATCSVVVPVTAVTNHVIRENETINFVTGTGLGQIGLSASTLWPFIQLYDFAEDGKPVITYDRAGGDETVTLLADDPTEEISFDRTSYPPGAQVFMTLMDQSWNVDPTDEDAYVIRTADGAQALHYQLYDENGQKDGSLDLALNTLDYYGVDVADYESDPFDEAVTINRAVQGDIVLNCQITDDFGSNVTIVPDADGGLSCQTDLISGSGTDFPIALVESGANTATFQSWSQDQKSDLVVPDDVPRGRSAEVEYEDPGFITLLSALDFGTISLDTSDLTGGEWNSGERIGITLSDADANTNSQIDEDLDVNNPDRLLIPSLRIGDPFTLGDAGTGDDTMLTALWTDVAIDTNGTGLAFDATLSAATGLFTGARNATFTETVEAFSDRASLVPDATPGLGIAPGDYAAGSGLFLDTFSTAADLFESISFTTSITTPGGFVGFNLLNYDLRSLEDTTTSGGVDDIILIHAPPTGAPGILDEPAIGALTLVADAGTQGLTTVSDIAAVNASAAANALPANVALFGIPPTDQIGYFINFTGPYEFVDANGIISANDTMPIVIDWFSFGLADQGILAADRVNNAIYRFELEETTDNSGIFEGTIEYTMLNQLNVLDKTTYENMRPIDSDVIFIVSEDFTDEDAPRVNYLDLGADGVSTQIGVQEDAPSHSGIVSFDLNTYKIADTVGINLEDADLNTDNDIVDIYSVLDTVPGFFTDPAFDTVGVDSLGTFPDGTAFGDLLDVTFDDELWLTSFVPNSDGVFCAAAPSGDDGLGSTGFTLVETSKDSGKFYGDFQVPADYCSRNTGGVIASVTGTDLEVNYNDFRDSSGEIVQVGDSAGIRANTGSVSLDRTVYPVPFGTVADAVGAGLDRSIFPIHATSAGDIEDVTVSSDTLGNGDLTVHVRINDPDFDISASGEDKIAAPAATARLNAGGPLEIMVTRGSDTVILGTAGAPSPIDGTITIGEDVTALTRELGPIDEIAPDAGIFELDLTVRYTDGPADGTCPTTTTYSDLGGAGPNPEDARFDGSPAGVDKHCILQGDILTVEYEDPTDASGDPNTVTDSATFDLRNGVLQSDKSVYIIGSDMILTLIEPDLDLENDGAETWDLDLIEWDSDADTLTMGDKGGEPAAFDPEPSNFRETGDSTGIFQIVIEIPAELAGDRLERGEEIILEYTDWGPSGADYVGDEDEDVNLTIFTSNFGATIELDQKVYSWTDKVYVTVVAPDHNFDSDLIDEIGETDTDPLKVSTRGFDLDKYKLVETGTDTGIFTGEVILTGFAHDADGDGTDENDPPKEGGSGPTDGFLPSDDDDGITVSFEFSEDETVVGSSLIRWNIGETQWLEASYPASGTGVVRIVDPDLNLNPESVDNFDVDVWSDSDSGGIDLTVTETNEATGIFEGTVFFTTTDESSGHRLRVSEGDTVTAEYEDNTLPDPYTTADELDIAGTALIGTVVPPLERAPASNCRIVDAFGNSLSGVAADQQVQIVCDLSNGQDRDQPFAYLVQLQDANGVTQSLSWITGSLAPGQSFSPSQSWTPEMSGSYDATVFVWESVDNPTALSPPVSIASNVQ